MYLGIEFTVEVVRLGSYWGLPGEVESSLESEISKVLKFLFLGGGT